MVVAPLQVVEYSFMGNFYRGRCGETPTMLDAKAK